MPALHTIGITVLSSHLNESLFTNGILQNAITLFKLLELCPNVRKVHLINLTPDEPLQANLLVNQYVGKVLDFKTALKSVGLIISGTVTLPDSDIQLAQASGVRYVAHIKGSIYHFLSEHVLFKEGPTPGNYLRKPKHTGAWISPHLFAANKDFVELTHDCRASIAPLIWTPEFIEQHTEELARSSNLPRTYTPKPRAKRISVFEPNINLLKTCITPILAVERAFRSEPGAIGHVSIFSAKEIAKKKTFIDWVIGLEIQKAKRITFEARFPIAWSLLAHSDILLSHQRDISLNYLYFDAAWLGYPVIHNSDDLQDFGYYYPGYDASVAAEQILRVCHEFDAKHEGNLRNARAYVSRFLWNHPSNVNAYSKLITEAMDA